VSSVVFDMIDEVFPVERGPNGEPAAGDFVAHELPTIVERFALDFDDLREVDGLSGTRELISPSIYAYALAAYGVLLTDGTIELISITIER
jgi:hypothetical protein